jgi:hypothetical protein
LEALVGPARQKWTLASPLFWKGRMSALVKSRHFAVQSPCPLYPRKRTCAVQLRMSALGHKRTHAVQQLGSLLDHLVSAGDERLRKGKAECFCGLEI